MTSDPEQIKSILTESQRQCIVSLSAEWQHTGYSKVNADILHTLGGSDLYGRYDSIVDLDYKYREDVSPTHRHRLLPLGIEVKAAILQSC